MRTVLIASFLALAPIAVSAVAAQETRRPQVVHVGNAPGLRLSIGTAQPVSEERLNIRARQELQADCTWAAAPDITVATESIVTLRDPAAVGGTEQFGALYANTYTSLAGYQGGTPTPEYLACVRQRMTERATAQ